MNKSENKKIANTLFPHIDSSIEKYIKKYPKRDLPTTAKITRFGPSPTGFLHIGGLFTAIVSERLAHQSKGVFFLRIEDTDKKREVKDGVRGIVSALEKFEIKIDEGIKSIDKKINKYGPYKQSDRKEIYLTFIKYLIETGNAYPCFCSPEELRIKRKSQELQKIRSGYYGEWALHRNITLDEVKNNLTQGRGFVIRLKSNGNEINKIPFNDLIKGNISIRENDLDVVLLKSDQLPTYHFAHVVDDYLMKTTHIIRGDEWLSSLPIHLQIFDLFNWQAPYYAHISPILKSDNGNKRKLSKRKDTEASVEYYFKEGYPSDAIIEYLLNIANPNFEDWRYQNPNLLNTEFEIKLEKFNKSGALFDINKLSNISKDIIAKMSENEMYDQTLKWTLEYDLNFAKKVSKNKDYLLKIFSVERNTDKPRKDIGKWSEVKNNIFYFFNDLFEEYISKNMITYPEILNENTVKEILTSYIKYYNSHLSKDDWFSDLKKFAESLGFASNIKLYKQKPNNYKGCVGDIAMVLRIALTSKSMAPDLHEIMHVMGEENVKERLQFSANNI
ncbi:MAG: glutamate--tRNA ligase [Candidatus Pacebacteria bacterium]|nr:glutamate--tRNA ligase [Candidatus Paceibacterota bacterium]